MPHGLFDAGWFFCIGISGGHDAVWNIYFLLEYIHPQNCTWMHAFNQTQHKAFACFVESDSKRNWRFLLDSIWNQFFFEKVSGYDQELKEFMIFDLSRNWNFILKATFRTKWLFSIKDSVLNCMCSPYWKICVCGRIAWDRLDLDSSRKVFWNLDFKRLEQMYSNLRENDFTE